MRKRAMHLQVWERKFLPQEDCLDNSLSVEDIQDLDFHNVWTLVTGDNGRDTYLVPGIHVVNRLGFVTTKNPWTDKHDREGLTVRVM